MSRWIVFIAALLLIEFYCFQAVRTSFENKWVRRIYLLISVLVAVFILVSFLKFDRSIGLGKWEMTVIAVLLLVYIPKLIVGIFLLIEDVFRIIFGAFGYFVKQGEGGSFLPERRAFISRSALALAAIPFGVMIYGIWKGRYNYKVLKSTLYFDDLPDEFDGFTILQLSDIHCGSFDNYEKIKAGIDLINEQEFDLLVFTGDLVNSKADEMNGWEDLLGAVRKPEFGKFSVLGNHDYGDYIDWPTKADRDNNLAAVKGLHPKIGFDLLLNENRVISKGNSSIRLVGVENWGKGRFQKYGDLYKAAAGVKEDEFKVLLTHDPSHWDEKVQNNPFHYHLTLSGHTHGMQFGIEIPGFKWSPSKYMYPHWAGLYENVGRYLYVNRGFGYLAFPGRVGIWPEITLLELKKKV